MFITLTSLLPPDSLVLLLLKYTILYLNKFRVKNKRGGGARENKKLFHETETFSFGKKQFWKIDMTLITVCICHPGNIEGSYLFSENVYIMHD